MQDNQEWEWEINTKASWLGSSLPEMYHYKDLLFRLVRKELLTSFQQTLLGPFWLFLQPLLTVFIYVIFSQVIGLSTDGVPSLLFYLSGIVLWNLFSELFTVVAYTFTSNAEVFSKVYFPRIIVPLSSLILNVLKTSIQLLLLVGVLLYYYFTDQGFLEISHMWMCIPAILLASGIALGGGLIFSVLTVKYKDLFGMMQLIIRLLMYVCPIFYSLSMVPARAKFLVSINPLSYPFELFRYAFTGRGQLTLGDCLYSCIFSFVILLAGIFLFNKTSDKLIDIV